MVVRVCDPARLVFPPVADAVYGYQVTNVEAQTAAPTPTPSPTTAADNQRRKRHGSHGGGGGQWWFQIGPITVPNTFPWSWIFHH